MKSIKEKIKESYDVLKVNFGYSNPMQAPKIMKVVISAGIGSKKEKKQIDLVEDRISRITGQKPVKKGAKVSLAAFKIRQGDTVGMQVTLRGQRMYDFLDRLINIALPRTKDFRGISAKSIDEMGNYTLGIREHTIFPETGDEELRDVFGLAVTIVTNLKNKEETRAFLAYLGFPFKKNETEEIKVKVTKKRVRIRKPKGDLSAPAETSVSAAI